MTLTTGADSVPPATPRAPRTPRTPRRVWAPRRARARRTNPAWVPRQHGAWAMLALPIAVGLIRTPGGPTWVQAGLAACWVSSYFAFSAIGVAIKTRGRHPGARGPVLVYALLTIALGAVLAVRRADLIGWAPLFLALGGVSLALTAARQERSLVNGVLTVATSSLFGLVIFAGGQDPAPLLALPGAPAMVILTAIQAAYFAGTVFYVKTLIRERRSPAHRLASIGYHAAVLVAAVGTAAWATVTGGLGSGGAMAWWTAAFFLVMAVRAAVMAGRSVRPMHVGLGELAGCAALLALAALWP